MVCIQKVRSCCFSFLFTESFFSSIVYKSFFSCMTSLSGTIGPTRVLGHSLGNIPAFLKSLIMVGVGWAPTESQYLDF